MLPVHCEKLSSGVVRPDLVVVLHGGGREAELHEAAILVEGHENGEHRNKGESSS